MMNVENWNVTELNAQEKLHIEGGGWIGDAWDAVCDAAKAVGNALVEAGEFALYLAAGIADGIDSGLGGCNCNGTGN